MDEELLAGNWQGLDRATAPHLLPAGKSPDTTDAAYSGDKQGLLGPRGGRKILLSEGYNILGVIPYSFPWAQGRLIPTDAGDIRYNEDSFPSLTTPSATGWDTIRIGESSPYVVQQINVGTTNGTALTLSTPLAMGDFGMISFAGPGSHYGTPLSISCVSGLVGYVMIQGYISSAWVDLYKINFDYSTFTGDIYQQQLEAGTGTLTAIRAAMTLSAGAGTAEVTFDDFQIKLHRGAQYREITAS